MVRGAPAEHAPSAEAPLFVDRYAIYDAIAAGGMATVHLGRLIGTAGFLRTVAIKRLHSQYAHDPEFTAMFLDEARLASRIQHPNVVATIDVVMKEHELLLVMEYVRGESLSRLVRRARDSGERLPPRVVVAIVSEALHGLHAAHEAGDEKGQPLGLVHRDMSPQNILVGTDGVSRVLDFGVAKAAGRIHTTRDGDIKGKVLYMSPEHLAAQPLTRTADIYAMGVVLFETLTSVRMFAGDNEGAALTKIIQNEIRVPSEIDPSLAPFDAIVRYATAARSEHRYPTALEMAVALEGVGVAPASPADVSACVQRLAGETLDERAKIVAEIERSSTRSKPPIAMGSSGSMKIGTPVKAQAMPTAETAVMSGIRAAATPAAAAAPPAARSFAIGGMVLLAVLLLGALGFIAVLLMRRDPVRTAAADPATATAPATPTGAATSAASAAPADTATAAIVRRPESAGAASAVTEATPPTTPAATTSAPPRKAPAAGPAPRVRPNCDPPYVVDKNGHQHFIPECMK